MGKGFGSLAETKDDEFEHLAVQASDLETLAKKLWDDAKRFKDSLSLMLAHQAAISEAFVAVLDHIKYTETKNGGLNNEDNPKDASSVLDRENNNNIARKFSVAMIDAKEILSQDLERIERLVVMPTGDYLLILRDVQKALTKRAHKMLDFDRHRQAVEKLKQKQNRTAQEEKTMGQCENSLDLAAREYNNINNLLKQDLPVIIATRVDFIDPCFLAFYEYQVKVYHTLYGIFYGVVNDNFDVNTSAAASYEAKAHAVQQLLNSLTIPQRLQQPSSEFLTPPVNATAATSRRISQPISLISVADMPPAYIQPSIPTTDAKPTFAVALFDFEGQEEGDLSFKRGDRIEVTERRADVNDWWIGTFNGKSGQFPGNFIFI